MAEPVVAEAPMERKVTVVAHADMAHMTHVAYMAHVTHVTHVTHMAAASHGGRAHAQRCHGRECD